jgi:hypothetical protein
MSRIAVQSLPFPRTSLAVRGILPARRPAGQSLAVTLFMLLAAVVCVVIGVLTRDTAVVALALPAGFGAAVLHRH